MSLLEQYLCGAVELTFLQRDASEKVQWVAKPFVEGELVKERIYRAYEEMPDLGYELIRSAWHRQIGPYQWPYVHNAWLAVANARAEKFQRTATEEQKRETPWLLIVTERPVEPITRAQANLALTIAGLRRRA